MALRIMVGGDTQAECQAGLDEVCQLPGVWPTTRPMDQVGRGWIARAERRDAPPSVEERGVVGR